MSSFFYFLKESLTGFTRNLSTALGSIVTIFLSLLIIGIFLVGGSVVNNVVKTGSADVIRSIQTSRDGFEMIFIPRERVGLVVGTRGATIQEVQRRTSTSVQVSKEADPDHPDMRSIVITGSKENVKEAKRQILKIADVTACVGREP